MSPSQQIPVTEENFITHSTHKDTSDITDSAKEITNDFTANGIRPAFGFKLDISSLLVLWPTWLVVITSVVLCAAALMNLWVLTIWLRSPTVGKSSFHILLMNHTVANFLMDVITYPLLVYRMTTLTVEGSDAQTIVCRFFSFTLILMIFVRLSCNSLIAINRAVSCYPNVKVASKLRDKKATAIFVITMWVTAFLYPVFSITLDTYGWDKAYMCMSVVQLIRDLRDPIMANRGETFRLLNSRVFVINAVLTLVACCSSYCIIARHLWIKHRQFLSTSSAAAAKRLRERKRGLAVIMATFTIFVICWMPTTFAVAYEADLIRHNPVLMALPALDSILDPLLYMITLPVFRPRFCLKQSQVTVILDSQDPNRVGQAGVQSRSTQVTRHK